MPVCRNNVKLNAANCYTKFFVFILQFSQIKISLNKIKTLDAGYSVETVLDHNNEQNHNLIESTRMHAALV